MSSLYEITTANAFVMKKPDDLSQVLGILNKGVQIDILNIINDWGYFKYNNQDAYIRKNNLKVITTTPIENKGSLIIKYLDINTNEEVYCSEILNNIAFGTYTYEIKNIYGYKSISETSQSITLIEDTPNQSITFYYEKILGSITIKYIDNITNEEIYDSSIINNLSLGSYTYSAIEITNYSLVDDTNKTVTLTESQYNTEINFIYKRIVGKVAINYVLQNTGESIVNPTIISNIPLGNYTYYAIDIAGYTIADCNFQTVTLDTSNYDISIAFKYEKDVIDLPEDLNINEVPYISTYYIKPIVKPNEEVFIDYYITDYWHKEYIEEDYSERFTVTVRIEGEKDKIFSNLKAGDHTVSLGSFSTEGEQKFSILCSDKYKRNSHELFNFFLVQDDVEIKEYIMTEEDLITYNIKNIDNYEEKVYVKVDKLTDATSGTKIEEIANSTIIPSKKYICFIGTTEEDENKNAIMQTKPARFWLNTIVKYADDYDKDSVLQEATNTRIGLQKLLNDKKSEGYNKLLLLFGTYRIDHSEPIYVPSEFTLDLNNSTIKENQFTGSNSLMISLDETFNSHVINGTIEGDYFSHDYANSKNNSEWPTGISISGYSKYSSFDNITVKNITGYGASNGLSNKSGYSYFTQSLGNIFTLGDINTSNGSTINSTIRQSSDFIDISKYVNFKYISINRYLGYQGMSGGTWNLILHFYDTNKKYIKSINSFQYRRTRIPPNSYYMKITILSNIESKDLWMTYFKTPYHCSFKNIKFENCRCVGLAQSAMSNMLVDNCEWTLNGQSGAFCAYDAEDGWDLMQDVTLSNLNFYNNYRNNLLTCAGHNFLIENIINGNIHIWPRTNSYVIRNCTNLSGAYLGRSSRELTGYVRFFNNIIKDNMKIAGESSYNWGISVKDCVINGKIECILGKDLFLRCNIGGNLISNDSIPNAIGGKFIDCYIHDRTTSHNSGGEYYNCNIKNLSGSLQSTHNYYNCIFINFKENPTDNSIINMYNCTLTNSFLNLGYWQKGATILIDSCTINNTSYILRLPHYSVKKPIAISNTKINSSNPSGIIIFYDDRTGGLAGELTTQDYLTLSSNIITLPNSAYIIGGISKSTINNINICFKNNTLTPKLLLLCDPTAYQNPNISIIE